MAASSKPPLVLATATLTVAIGLTVASLTGYLRPRSPTPERSATPTTPEPGPVVLVPVTATAQPAAPPERAPMFASYTRHHEEREHARRGGEREHDREDE
jgi:hypothetical protein